MTWINYYVKSKHAYNYEGHTDNLLTRFSKRQDHEAYYCAFDCKAELLKIEDGKPTFKGYDGETRPALGYVVFDFDSSELEKSFEDSKSLINYLNVPCLLFFSGSKGFHVYVAASYFGDLGEQSHRTVKRLAEKFSERLPTLDTAIYNSNRKIRAPFSKHPKTNLYKILVDASSTVDRILIDARECSPQVLEAYPEREPVLAHFIQSLPTIDNASAADFQGSVFSTFDKKLCIKRLIDERCNDGERNNTALVIVNDLYKTGHHERDTYAIMNEWAVKNSLPISEIQTILRNVYGGQVYDHGCQDPIKAAKCSSKCKIYKKLEPEKRPDVLDLPASLIEMTAKPATKFIERWIEENIVTVTLAGNWHLNNDMRTPIPRNVIEDKIFNASDLVSRKEYKMVSQNKIISYLNEWEERAKTARMKDLVDNVAYSGDNRGVNNFLEALLSETPTELQVKVFKHWLWLVKRKLNKKKTERELMIIIAGITNTGKTHAVTKVFEPIKELVDTMMLELLNDERHDFRLVNNAVIFFDEMAATKKVNVDALKNKITSKWINYRPLGKTSRVQDRNFSSFIGTTNNRVIDIIKDPTSSRRYFEFWVEKRCDWKSINDIDYLELWRGIDENRSEPYINGSLKELEDEQMKIRAKDSVEEWLDVEELLPGKDEKIYGVGCTEAYNAYKEWMNDQNRQRYVFSKQKFFNRMADMGLKSRDMKRRFYIIRNVILNT